MTNFTYKIIKDKYDTNEMFIRKEEFITVLNPKNKKDLDYSINLANIFNNMLILKCRYPTKLEQLIFETCTKIKNKLNFNCDIKNLNIL